MPNFQKLKVFQNGVSFYTHISNVRIPGAQHPQQYIVLPVFLNSAILVGDSM